MTKRLLIPALSLTKADPGIVNEAWELIKYLPTQTRYNMYSEWFGGQTSRMEDIKVAFDLSRTQAKDVLKRISKTNVKEMARALAPHLPAAMSVRQASLLNLFRQAESSGVYHEVFADAERFAALPQR